MRNSVSDHEWRPSIKIRLPFSLEQSSRAVVSFSQEEDILWRTILLLFLPQNVLMWKLNSRQTVYAVFTYVFSHLGCWWCHAPTLDGSEFCKMLTFLLCRRTRAMWRDGTYQIHRSSGINCTVDAASHASLSRRRVFEDWLPACITNAATNSSMPAIFISPAYSLRCSPFFRASGPSTVYDALSLLSPLISLMAQEARVLLYNTTKVMA